MRDKLIRADIDSLSVDRQTWYKENVEVYNLQLKLLKDAEGELLNKKKEISERFTQLEKEDVILHSTIHNLPKHVASDFVQMIKGIMVKNYIYNFSLYY